MLRTETPARSTATGKTPPVVVNVFNTLSQTTTVTFSQVIEAAESLPPEQREGARAAAEEFKTEADGQQRWPVLARPLEKLQALGKPAYEKVALPLLLEFIKKQAGL